MKAIRPFQVAALLGLAVISFSSSAQTASFADLSHPLATGWTTVLAPGFLPQLETRPTVDHILTVTMSDATQLSFRALMEAPEGQVASVITVRHSFVDLHAGFVGTITALRADFTPYAPSTDLLTGPGFDTVFEDLDFTPFEPAHYRFTNASGAAFILVGDGSGHFSVSAPIPEPETYAMLLAGLALLGFLTRRRRTVLAAA